MQRSVHQLIGLRRLLEKSVEALDAGSVEIEAEVTEVHKDDFVVTTGRRPISFTPQKILKPD